MNTWTKIKSLMVENQREGSVGYLLSVNRANDLYMAIREGLMTTVMEQSDACFNADKDITQALSQRRQLEILSGCK